MQIQHITQSIIKSFLLTVSFMITAILAFGILEPTVSRAVTDEFTIRQQITDEISFLVPAANVTMVGSIAGITGGNATGTTFAVVQTNSPTGYTMNISFLNNPAMLGETTGSTAIRDYGTSTAAEPTFVYNASTSAQFAYTVSASTTSDVDQSFRDNGSVCNTGSGDVANACWKGPSTSNFQIINRTTSANSGATTSIQFRVSVPNNPSPALEEDFYTATATLTAVTQ